MPDRIQYTLSWLFFGFTGRIRRATYVWSAVFFVAIYTYVVVQIVQTPEDSALFGLWGLVMFAVLVVSAWAGIALSAKRLHDLGYSGLFALIMFFPMVSILFFALLCVWPGEPVPNRFGESPVVEAD